MKHFRKDFGQGLQNLIDSLPLHSVFDGITQTRLNQQDLSLT